MIPQSFIQELLGRVDIVDLVDRHVKLKRAGSNFVACCPFHSEKTPSFTVSPTKQFYHCFGCGAHGTAIGFLMEHSGYGFVDAVKELAQNAGLVVPEMRPEAGQRRADEGEDLYELLLRAARYYRARLKDAPEVIAYLKTRGLSGEIAKQFGIGYAPDGWHNLADVFPDYKAKALLSAGLVKANEEGKRYDVFRNRVMFPIVDVRGKVIGFGGRVLGDGDGPKYLNSPETPVFEKGRELYGLYQARRAIRDAGRAVVVEGYMDVVALAQHGVCYAVATLGTATTAAHVQKLLRQTDEIVFCFDGDAAGRRAAWRALENSLSQLSDNKQIRFLFLPEGEDPDTFVRRVGQQSFESEIERATPLSQFLIDELTGQGDLSTHEGRAKLLQTARPLIKQVAAPMLSLLLRKELARIAGITQPELDGQYQIKPAPAGPQPGAKAQARKLKASLARELLERLVFDPSLAQLADAAALSGVVDQLGTDVDPTEVRALARLVEILAAEPHISNLAEYFRGSELEPLIKEAELNSLRLQELNLQPADLQREFADGWSGLLARIRRDIERRAGKKIPLPSPPAATEAK